MATFYDNFGTYSTGDLATNSGGNWTDISTNAGWTILVTSDGAATGGKTAVIADTFGGGGGWGSDARSAYVSALAGTTGDIEIVCKWKYGAGSLLGSGQGYGPCLIDPSNSHAYGVFNTGTSTWRIGYLTGAGSVFDFIGSAVNVSVAPASGTYVWVRLGVNSTTVRAKVWLDGNSEPGSWQLSGTDSTYLRSGSPASLRGGIWAQDDNYDPFTIDVLGVGTGVDSAPVSAGTDTLMAQILT